MTTCDMFISVASQYKPSDRIGVYLLVWSTWTLLAYPCPSDVICKFAALQLVSIVNQYPRKAPTRDFLHLQRTINPASTSICLIVVRGFIYILRATEKVEEAARLAGLANRLAC